MTSNSTETTKSMGTIEETKWMDLAHILEKKIYVDPDTLEKKIYLDQEAIEISKKNKTEKIILINENGAIVTIIKRWMPPKIADALAFYLRDSVKWEIHKVRVLINGSMSQEEHMSVEN